MVDNSSPPIVWWMGSKTATVSEMKIDLQQPTRISFQQRVRDRRDGCDGNKPTSPGRVVTAPVSRKLGGGSREQRVKQRVVASIGGVDALAVRDVQRAHNHRLESGDI
jgi:hypothetical protein